MTEPRIDAEFVAEWAAAYPTGADGRVLEVVHPAVRERGYFTAAEAEDVIKWKSNRTITFLRRNDPQDVEVITGMALVLQPDLVCGLRCVGLVVTVR